jgi:hypothetical protein
MKKKTNGIDSFFNMLIDIAKKEKIKTKQNEKILRLSNSRKRNKTS